MRLVSLGLFALTAAYSVDSRASAKTSRVANPAGFQCTLYYAELGPAEKAAWTALGYNLQLRTNLPSFSHQAVAQILGEKGFALISKKSHVELWFGTGEIVEPRNWKPLSIRAPEKGALPSQVYSCKAMLLQKTFFAEARKSIYAGLVLSSLEIKAQKSTDENSKPKPTGLSYGETMLGIERSYFVHQGTAEGNPVAVRARYQKILETVKKIRAGDDQDFFEAWTAVRKSVYDGSTGKIEYCLDRTSMTEALVNNCTNCIGETFLLYALFKDAGFEPPQGWTLGVQDFRDHLRLIIYNEKDKRIHDLATGSFSNFRSTLRGPEFLLIALLRGHGALRFDNEKTWIFQQDAKLIYNSCYIPVPSSRAANSPSDGTYGKSCEKFIPGNEPPPEHASNAGKTDGPHEETLGDLPGGSGSSAAKGDAAKNEGSGSTGTGDGGAAGSLWEKLKGLSGAVANGLSGFGNFSSDEDDLIKPWIKYLRADGDNDGALRKRYLTLLAGTLIPEERQAVLDSLDLFEPNAALVKAFSLGSHLEALGAGHYRELPNYKFKNADGHRRIAWHTLINPPLIIAKSEHANYRLAPAMAEGLCDKVDGKISCKITMPSRCEFEGLDLGPCLVVTDDSLRNRLYGLPVAERYKLILQLLADQIRPQVEKMQAAVADPEMLPTEFLKKLGPLTSELDLQKVRAEVLMFGGLIEITHDIEDPNAYDRSTRMQSLKDASIKFFGVSNIRKIDRYITQVAKTFAEPAGLLLPVLDQMDAATLNRLKMHLPNIEDMREALINATTYTTIGTELQSRIRAVKDPLTRLLESTLLDARFFFTVEPEENEKIPGRPYDPWKIEDPRIQDLIATAVTDRLPLVNLPISPGSNPCLPGDKGYKQSGMFFVNCATNKKIRPGDKNQNEDSLQLGLAKTSKPGKELSTKLGEDLRKVPNGLRLNTEGTEAEGREAYAQNLTPEQLRITPNQQAVSVSAAATSDAVSVTDPRQEVHLRLSTWDFLQPGRNFKDINGTVLVLLHHAFRKKLDPIFNFYRVIHWTEVDAPLYSSTQGGLTKLLWRGIYGCGTATSDCSRALAEEFYDSLMRTDWLDASDGYPFLAAAHEELKNPKMGYVVMTGKRLNMSDESVRDSLLQLGQQIRSQGRRDRDNSSSPPGRLLPIVTVGDDGQEYATLGVRGQLVSEFMSYLEKRGKLDEKQIGSSASLSFTANTSLLRDGATGRYVLASDDRESTFQGLGDFAGELNLWKVNRLVEILTASSPRVSGRCDPMVKDCRAKDNGSGNGHGNKGTDPRTDGSTGKGEVGPYILKPQR